MSHIIRHVRILGTGSYVPDQIVTNEHLAAQVPTSDEWIRRTLGIRERRIAAPHQFTSDLAAIAAERALAQAGIAKESIDLIIVATATPDRLAPSTACIVQHKLQIAGSVAFDIAAVCSGFLYALSIGAQFIAARVYDRVLVIGADTFSRITDWQKRECVFFGDGAGAVVLTHLGEEEDGGFLAFRLYADGRGRHDFTVPAGGSELPANEATVRERLHFFRMNGSAVYRFATTVLPPTIRQVLADTKLRIDDIDFMIPHQPSIAILRDTAQAIGLPFAKVMTNMDRYANTAGGTIPILLDETNRSGRLKPGHHILFAAVGAGWTWGASIIRWS